MFKLGMYSHTVRICYLNRWNFIFFLLSPEKLVSDKCVMCNEDVA